MPLSKSTAVLPLVCNGSPTDNNGSSPMSSLLARDEMEHHSSDVVFEGSQVYECDDITQENAEEPDEHSHNHESDEEQLHDDVHSKDPSDSDTDPTERQDPPV